MPMLKLALIVGACASLCVSAASWSAGYPPEIAITRGVGAFMALSVLGFLAELIASRVSAASLPTHEATEELESTS